MNGSTQPDMDGPSDGGSATTRQRTKDEMCCCCICFHPRCLQPLASLTLFIINVCLLLCFSAAALAVFEGLVTTIETRYQLSAAEIGLSASMFTAGTAVSTVIVTHFGGRPTSRRPIWIGLGGLCLALGAALHALPQFVLSPYQPPSSVFLGSSSDTNSSEFISGLCNSDAGIGTGDDSSCEAEDREILRDNNVAYIIIVIGQIVLGVGYGPLVPLTLAYVDDNATRGTTGLASGILESMFGLGAIIGFQIASAVVGLWVDFYRVDAATVSGLTPHDHGWVGAWWLGMLIEAVIFFVLALPMFGFPMRIPGARKDKDAKRVEEIDLGGNDGDEIVKTSALKDLKEWPRSVWRLLKNLVFLLACLSFVTEGALVYSLAAFFPKYMQVQFGLDVFSANLIAGFAFVPPWAIGALIGGIIVKKLGPHIQGSAAMGLVSGVLACSFTVVLIFIGCDNPPIAGVTVGYHGYDLDPNLSLESACNTDCLCPVDTAYAPQCGSDGVTYFSPCHAGCTQIPGNKTYTGCSCLMPDDPATTPSDVMVTPTPSALTFGLCPYTCTNVVAFIVLMVLWAITLSSATSPRIIIIVSSVHPSDKSLALGISRVLMLLIGSLPFPFLYGACIDSACLVWQTLCGERGSCSIYDIVQFRRTIYALTAALIAVQCLAFAAIWLIARMRAKQNTQGKNANGEMAGTEAAGKDGAKMSPPNGSQNEGYANEEGTFM
ncbi:solute carrier organic anion transporter family member 3A1-like [Patiria miniata]|uniref:Solute carrier organic anion transporter family member n=1 Tax=Patiria miniata TaxID=46514 RepID=A0A914AM27_PATMI|nr:solute carrier organic anion transporter family member 3A1-like [Patiria miniata]XP_038064644.1 solute carrier organic anion transporter family member 3A1-like [Patiria miniata]XP_038064645.1 solute carrier organic anion transporter family member 3A1-like [Patiria miniata]